MGVSCTGKGEAFIRAVTAKGIACRLAAGLPLAQALRLALDEVANQEAVGGVIALTAEGRLGLAFNSARMAYAWRTPSSVEAQVALEAGAWVVTE